MARSQKNGLDYFPLDVADDMKTQFMIAEFGGTGIAVLITLQKMIFAEGIYIKWNEDMAFLLAHNLKYKPDTVERIVEAAVKRGIFDDELFETHRILTSREIQEQYFTITVRRKDAAFDKRYLLLADNEAQDADNMQTACAQDEDKNPQRKENDKKEKEIEIENETTENKNALCADAQATDFESFWSAYPRKTGRFSAQKLFDRLDMTPELLDKMLSAIKWQKNTPQWQENEGRFIPYPVTWLTQKMWEDEVPEPVKKEPEPFIPFWEQLP